MPTIAIMLADGILDVKIGQKTANGNNFYNFVELPHLQPFDGTSSHRVVIMDNCSIHHTQDSLIQEVGVTVHFFHLIPQT